MIDIHSHVLPKIDDGPNSWEDTLAMLHQAEEDGIAEVAITHHIVSNMDYRREEEIILKFKELKERIAFEKIKIKIHLGSEIYAQPDMELYHSISTYNDNKKYFLVEFPMQGIPRFVADRFFDLILEGLVPIVAHPERNLGIIRNPQRAYEFVQRGALLQMNAGSILGRHGEPVKDTAEILLNGNLIHFVGSDGHNTRRRPLKLRAAREAVASGWGEARAALLFRENPQKALAGQEITISEPLPVEVKRGKGLLNPIKMIKRILAELR
ncbi:MAG: tyrosine-protein phosphatase [bacterium]